MFFYTVTDLVVTQTVVNSIAMCALTIALLTIRSETDSITINIISFYVDID